MKKLPKTLLPSFTLHFEELPKKRLKGLKPLAMIKRRTKVQTLSRVRKPQTIHLSGLFNWFGIIRGWARTHAPNFKLLKSSRKSFNKAHTFLKQGVFKFKKRKHLEITIRLTWVKVLALVFLGTLLWPNKHVIAEPNTNPANVYPTLPEASVAPFESQEHKEPIAPPKPVSQAPVSGDVNCGSDTEMAYIYKVESGCRTWAYNPGGCRGLGQSCPGSKLPCGDYDWACQDSWFRNYAVARYGSIHNAYLYRTSHNYW